MLRIYRTLGTLSGFRDALWRSRGGPYFLGILGFAYLLFSVSPHFKSVTHTHTGGDHPHHHNYLSAHDVALERFILAEVGDVLEGAEAHAEVQPEVRTEVRAEVSGKLLVPPAGTQGIHAKSDRHTHSQSDPNLISVLSAARAVQFSFAQLTRIEPTATPVADAEALRASARAPPVRVV